MCSRPCNANGDCGGGACENGFCFGACAQDADCRVDYFCVAGVCKGTRPPDLGAADGALSHFGSPDLRVSRGQDFATQEDLATPQDLAAPAADLTHHKVDGGHLTPPPMCAAPDGGAPLQADGGVGVPPIPERPTFATAQLLSRSSFQVAGDFNCDGRIDLVTSDWSSPAVHVLLNLGGGRFTTPRDYAVPGKNLRMVLMSDFDRDHHLDLLAVTDVGAWMLRGRGDGTFEKPVQTILGSFDELTAADLDGDGIPDLVDFHWSGSRIDLHRGKGDGSFAPPATVLQENHLLALETLADVDEDGVRDIVVRFDDGTIDLYSGDGKGGYSGPNPIAAGPNNQSFSFALLDVNHDGHLDGVLAPGEIISYDPMFPPQKLWTDSQLHVWLGDGNGAFQEAAGADFGTCGPGWIAPGDWNGDGAPDLAVYCDGMRVALGDGKGGFAVLPDAYPGSAYVSGDFDGDGKDDLLAAGETLLFHGRGDGTFEAPADYTFPGQGGADGQFLDFDGDGHLDVLQLEVDWCCHSGLGNGYPLNAWLRKGDGKGHLSPAAWVGYLGYRVVCLTAADLDGDGKKELIPCRDAINGGAPAYFAGPVEINGTPLEILTGDLNGDGWIDLVYREGGTFGVAVNQGKGKFGAPVEQAADVERFVLGDLTGDNRPEIVTLGAQLQVWINDGKGNFKAGAAYAVGATPTALGLADLDGDGRRDVVVVNHDDASVGVLLNLGGGKLGAMAKFPIGGAGSEITTGDFDKDGHLDIAVSLDDVNAVLRGDGKGGLAAPVVVWPSGARLAAGDLDEDGRVDLVSYGGDVVVLLNKTK